MTSYKKYIWRDPIDTDRLHIGEGRIVTVGTETNRDMTLAATLHVDYYWLLGCDMDVNDIPTEPVEFVAKTEIFLNYF